MSSKSICLALLLACLPQMAAADKPIKTFILAGQSNMVGWGDSQKLPEAWAEGNDRILMFEKGKWQPLRPVQKASESQAKRFEMTEFTFGPEIALAHTIAQAWPDETIGIVKYAEGGTSILTWKPGWSRKDADRIGQGNRGSMFQKLKAKLAAASRARELEVVGFLWVQGGKDMQNADVAKEYLTHLKSLVAAVRTETDSPDLPFYCASVRRSEDPDDLSDLQPKRVPGRYPGAEYVLKAQWDARTEIPHTRVVILRDIETHPKNVHYNTAGQIKVGKRFAEAVLADVHP